MNRTQSVRDYLVPKIETCKAVTLKVDKHIVGFTINKSACLLPLLLFFELFIYIGIKSDIIKYAQIRCDKFCF